MILLVSLVFAADGSIIKLDCSTFGETDADGDGTSVEGVACLLDCDDTNPNMYPGNTEICDNGIDDDCVGGDKQCPSSGSPGGSGSNNNNRGSSLDTFIEVLVDSNIITETNSNARIPIIVSYKGAGSYYSRVLKNVELRIAGLSSDAYKIVSPRNRDIAYENSETWYLIVDSDNTFYGRLSAIADGTEYITSSTHKSLEGERTFLLRVDKAQVRDSGDQNIVIPDTSNNQGQQQQETTDSGSTTTSKDSSSKTDAESKEGCSFIGLNIGRFILCWYWWAIIHIVLILILLTFAVVDTEKEERIYKRRRLLYGYSGSLIILILLPYLFYLFLTPPLNIAIVVFIDLVALIYFIADYFKPGKKSKPKKVLPQKDIKKIDKMKLTKDVPDVEVLPKKSGKKKITPYAKHMVSSSLVEYIRGQLKSGNSAESIKNVFYGYGYPKDFVEHLISEAKKKGGKK